VCLACELQRCAGVVGRPFAWPARGQGCGRPCWRDHPTASALSTWPDAPVRIAETRAGVFHPRRPGAGSPAPLSLDCHFLARTGIQKSVELRGFEPLTSCMPYRPRPSLSVAWHRLASRLAAAIMARRGLTSPGSCRHWLPTWLPAKSLAPLMLEARIATPEANARRPGERADQRRRMTASA
jgi:hypothetical protein